MILAINLSNNAFFLPIFLLFSDDLLSKVRLSTIALISYAQEKGNERMLGAHNCCASSAPGLAEKLAHLTPCRPSEL